MALKPSMSMTTMENAWPWVSASSISRRSTVGRKRRVSNRVNVSEPASSSPTRSSSEASILRIADSRVRMATTASAVGLATPSALARPSCSSTSAISARTWSVSLLWPMIGMPLCRNHRPNSDSDSSPEAASLPLARA